VSDLGWAHFGVQFHVALSQDLCIGIARVLLFQSFKMSHPADLDGYFLILDEEDGL
jgi:hypothetical protein